MTDHQPPPRDEAAVRRLLRRARHEEPLPPDVAARLEATLAGLAPSDVIRDAEGAGEGAGEGTGHGADGRGVLSPAHRRRRRATALLVAAVSVVVVGIGLGQVLRPAGEDESAASTSVADGLARETPPDRAEGQPDGGLGEPVTPRTGDGAAQESGPEARSDRRARPDGVRGAALLALLDDPPRVSEARFTRDVRAVRRQERGARATRASAGPDATFTCETGDWGPGLPVAVRYEQAPAVLVLRPATRDTQVADLVECGSAEVLRSVTLPR